MFKRIYIELSNYCNLNCVFCTPTDKSNRMLSLDQFKYIFDQVKEETDEVCLHVLGEPLIHPNFLEIIDYINQTDVKIMISTNARLIPSLSKDLINRRIDTFNISLHSTYTLNDLDRTVFINALLVFIDKYQEIHKSNMHLRLWADSNEMIKLNNDKIRNQLFDYYKFSGEITSRIRFKERIILSYEHEFEWPSLDLKDSFDGFCLGGKTHIAILANGIVTLCCLDSKGLTNLGNIFEHSLKEILEDTPYKDSIKAFRDNKCYFELCKHCTYKRKKIK